MQSKDLVNYLDNYLRIGEIKDYGPQGLQLEASNSEVNRIALAVDVSLPGIEAAAQWQADMLLVHHGILWREVERIAGPLGARVRAMLAAGINLYGAHLPLDVHPEVGNNAVLARMFDVEISGWWADAMGTPLAVIGSLAEPVSREAFVEEIGHRLKRPARLLPHGPEAVQQVAILSGFGADRVAEARAAGADTFLTGESSHQNYWAAADHGLNVIYAGHYATETVGVQALGQHLEEKFGVETRFFDFPTGM